MPYNSTETSDDKQGVKTVDAVDLFEQKFRPYATSFPGLLLTLAFMSKSKTTLETSLNLMPSFKDLRWRKDEGLFSNVNFLENRGSNFIQRNMAVKDVSRTHTFCSLDCNFSFCTEFYTDDS